MSSSPIDCWQINLQEGFGGGEIYTGFFVKALQRLGVRCHVVVSDRAHHWQKLLPADTEIVAVNSGNEILAHLPRERIWIVSHGSLPAQIAQALAAKHLLTAIAHMPPQGRLNDRYEHFHRVFGVSAYVIHGLSKLGVPTWEEPLYGVANLRRGDSSHILHQTSCYSWDRRKGRDQLLALMEPWVERFRARPAFERKPGVTLGIVSRLTPIKQFPQMFEILAPILAKHSTFNLEVFGSGGFASVRDLRHAARPLGKRIRFWGQQHDIAAVYRQLDYLLTGLPEKEALGLNIIEAQACGTPVLAIDAPPFTETVLDEKTGLLYADPRLDKGADFSQLLERISNHPFRIDMDASCQGHLNRFSEEAFGARVSDLLTRCVEKNL